jgi:hypothetical protein
MSRFPKGLLLFAVLAELMILTVASRTEVLKQIAEPQPEINVITVAPALPDQATAAKKRAHVVPAQATQKPSGQVITVEFETAPQPVM